MAQNTESTTNKVVKEQDIIIRKKGDKVAKTTIVIDGDNVTINGKPLDEFNSEGLTIIKRAAPAIPPTPRFRATAPRGGVQMFEGGATFGSNKALLGVTSEKADNGAKITEVSKATAAEKAGLQIGDVITKVGSTKIEGPAELSEAIGKLKPGEKVDITYKRGNKEMKTTATLGQNKPQAFSFNFDKDFEFNMPTPPNAPEGFFNFSRRPKIGLQIQDVEEGKGVVVKDVDDDSPAAKAGFKEGDIITEVNGIYITGVDEMRNQIKDFKEGDSFKVQFKRNGSVQTSDIKLPKRMKTADL